MRAEAIGGRRAQGAADAGREGREARVLISAPASSSGKTTVTCAVLRALTRRGCKVSACKCGPDYLDPLFHTRVLGVPSRNLDLFLADASQVRSVLARTARTCDITVIEGAMGYYDGIAVSADASAWDVARLTNTPAVLVLDARGRGLSLAAEVAGLASLRDPSMVRGVILNRISPALYDRIKPVIEQETGIPVLGYFPSLPDCAFESRHLGLVSAGEVADLQEKVDALADAAEQCIDLDALINVAGNASALEEEQPLPSPLSLPRTPRIAVAHDAAFSFYYADTLELLEALGARLVLFSPLQDTALPAGVNGLYLGGGYPELHAAQLSANASMLASVRRAVAEGLPTIAECGGFLYLHESLEDEGGACHSLVGAVPARAFPTRKLGRFGYVTLEALEGGLLADAGQKLRAHEFHYWDSTLPGDAFDARKPQSARSWTCAHVTPTLYAGFPHLYLPSHPWAAKRFLSACAAFEERA